MTNLLDVVSKKFSRRKFIGWSAGIAAGAAATGSIVGGLKKVEEIAEASDGDAGEKWVNAACWHNCGGRCLNKALVVDGVVVRQKTDDTIQDSADTPQQRACIRGRSQRKQVFAADRLKYPMKRKNWQPGGGNKELRGKDEWERISWDEAFTYIANEMKRIRSAYGNNSILCTGGSDTTRLLALDGGYTNNWGTLSWGSWRWGPAKFGMAEGFGKTSLNDRLDLRNSQLIVMVGANPAWSSMGNPTYHYYQAKKAGAKFVVIDPMYTDTAATLGDQWIPIRTGTDHAMFLGMAYTLLKEDDPITNPLIDWDFLHRCTIGFDRSHLPAGADPKENFKDYVLGIHDDTPKTPEWASEICGVEPLVIERLAREIARTERVALLTGWAPARIHNSDSWPQMFMTFGAMTGCMGKSGAMTGVSCHYNAASGGPRLVYGGGSGMNYIKNPSPESINDAELWDAILKGKFTAGKDVKKDINIQMIYHGYNAVLQTRQNMRTGIEAHRHVEFVVTNAHFLTTNALYSDIVLPATTEWEKVGGLSYGNRDMMIAYSQVIEPLYEAKSDREISIGIAEKLGYKEKDLYEISEKQAFFNQLAGAEVIKPDASGYETLLTITKEDIKEWGVEGTPQNGRIPLKKLLEDGVYQVPRKPGDKFGHIEYEAFRKDPVNNPLSTESGKLEIYCNALKELIDNNGWTTIRPIPTYNPPIEGYEETFADWKNKKKGKYPLQLMNPHYLRRSHSIFDNIPWLREAWASPVFLSAKDAQDRGIKTGDTVLIKNDHGQSLRIAEVSERLMPGTVGLPHGAWVDVDEKTGIDRAGADNYLTGGIPSGQGICGWNSHICEVEKWTGEPLKPDVEWKSRKIF
ncbi:dimethyl sulfoxide reductase subunit A [Bacillus sp. HMF5848]|uniref:molybdopterin-dependent oxidoreductase n=1 Tax=Bacillus sp. HMF5848 TaxID=2495421 RepID=UPI000F7A91E6|nr:molybdopterin-dependent oxidoreductase [Bacillus sp. HMF5848]RSK27561.1 dimethyl sulfoxide reductase subunit A [Bacillus sp. HMF5848]